jgi:hypothetical protein
LFLFFNHKTIQLCQKIKRAEETRAAAVEIAVRTLKEGLLQLTNKQEKEYHAKVAKPLRVAVVKAKVEAVVIIKAVNLAR